MIAIRHLFLVALVFRLGLSASAADSYWGTATGNFSDGGNWTGGVPGIGDNANFANNATYTVNFTADAQCDNALFSAAGGAVTLDTTDSYEWTLSGGVTLANTMTLNLKRGELTTSGDSTLNYATIFELGNSGVSGQSFTWNITGGTTNFTTAGTPGERDDFLHIGKFNRYGQGILNISGASTVVSNNNWVHIGWATWGSPGNQLNITDGAKLNTTGNSYIGWSSANNQVVVDGTGSQWTVTSVALGKGSGTDNTLTVRNGGKLVGSVYAGVEGDNNQVLITGAGSSVTASGASGVAASSNADNNTLTIADGASFDLSGANFGLGNGASVGNTVHVTGASSSLTTDRFYISGSNTRFRVTDGGYANLLQWGGNGTAGGTDTVIEVTDPDSELSIDKCNLGASVSLNVTNGGAFESRSGSVYLGEGSGAEASVLVSGAGSTFSSTGAPFRVASQSDARITVEDGGEFDHRELASNWGVSIGHAASETGTVTVTGANSVFRYTDVDNGNGVVAVGGSGVGILTIADGGLVEDGHAWIGAGSGSTGAVTISGSSSTWTNSGNLSIGRSAGDSSATLTYEADAAGVGLVNAAAVTLYGGSALVVNLSALRRLQSLPLVDHTSVTGTFDSVTVTDDVKGALTAFAGPFTDLSSVPNGQYYLEYDATGTKIVLHVNNTDKGSVILVR